ncbi:MAG: hypothetical protein LBJ99_04995 [Oscillospiraceae bacterium]|jgi:hypothetical protein|nr:hypothetical protein [Oscillospiraceae bacterium]
MGKIAIAAVLSLALSLTACGDGSGDTSSPPNGGRAQSAGDPSPVSAAVGNIDDGAAHGKRETYLFSFLHEGASPLDSAYFAMMSRFGGTMNFTLTETLFGGDYGTVADKLGALTEMDVDGLIISASGDDLAATNNYCNELDIPHVYVFNAPRGASGEVLAPCVELDMTFAGRFMTDWLNTHARNTWGDEYAPEKTGFIATGWDGDPKLASMGGGSALRVTELYPELAGNIIYASLPSDGGMTQEAAYNAVYMAIITYRGVDRWLIPCVSDEFGLSVARAAETLGVSDRVLIISPEMETVFEYWDADGGDALTAAVTVDAPVNTGTALAGLIALCDGRASRDTLWQELRGPGEAFSVFKGRLRAVTRAEYLDYRQYVNAFFD